MNMRLSPTIARIAFIGAILLHLETAATQSLANVDHVILGIANLDQGIEEFERLTGVRPVYGGKHPTGTHNALVALGGRTYLEILAPQPGSFPPAEFSELPLLKELTPVGWALTFQDVTRLQDGIAAAGLRVTAPIEGSRKTPQGAALQWVMFDLQQRVDAAPFFITWRPGSAHPSATSPGGCSVERWAVAGPENDVLDRLRSLIGPPVAIAIAPATALSLTLRCPKGLVRFEHGPAQRP
jgi:hypothetical protein